jgi:predicted RNA binding protein YcfA (HicA-like mRNA interferase family)
MRFNELVKLLEKAGFRLVSTGKSSKRIYSDGKRTVMIHYHSQQEVKTGRASRILKDAGIIR